jgi:glutamate formiminotransferase/formiminotetrahydrofolate cyclodeaminase
MAETGNPNSVSDAGVGALCARAAIWGAYLNVKINAADLKDETFKTDVLNKAESIVKQADVLEKEIMAIVNKKISG